MSKWVINTNYIKELILIEDVREKARWTKEGAKVVTTSSIILIMFEYILLN
jgi:hypothetical protein